MPDHIPGWYEAPPEYQNPPMIEVSSDGEVSGLAPRTSIARYAVILTHNRPVELRRAVEAVAWQADYVWIIDNASDPPVSVLGWPGNVRVEHDPTQPANLSRLWNRALDNIAEHAAAHGADRWDVALLCDDVEVPSGWYDRVSGTMRAYNASAASAHKYQDIGQAILKIAPDGDFMSTMCGWAFILPGEKGLRADESLHWWWLDNDVDWQARKADGMVLASGPPAHNGQPNHWTNAKPELGEQAGRDREAFRRKWGTNPW